MQSTESIIPTDPFLSTESVLSIASEDEKEDKKKLGKAHKIIIPFDYEIEIALKDTFLNSFFCNNEELIPNITRSMKRQMVQTNIYKRLYQTSKSKVYLK